MAEHTAGGNDSGHRITWPEQKGDAVRPDGAESRGAVHVADSADSRAAVITVTDAIVGQHQGCVPTASRPRARRSVGRAADAEGAAPQFSRWIVALLAVAAIGLVEPAEISSPPAAGRADATRPNVAPALPATPTGALVVRTAPEAARVVVDGQDRGVTPLEIADLRAGRHRVVLESPTGRVDRAVIVREGETTVVIEAMIAGWIAVFSRVRLDIYAKGRLLGSTEDGHLMIEPGRHRLDFVNARLGVRTTHELDVDPGSVTAYTVPLPNGTVRFDGEVGTEVSVDGKRLGVAPLEATELPIGTREFHMRFPDGSEAVAQVEIVVGQPSTLTIDRASAGQTRPATAALKAFPPGSGG